jgi:hypothetical protein
VDDPGVVRLELLDQLLRGHVPHKDVLSHPGYGPILTLQSSFFLEGEAPHQYVNDSRVIPLCMQISP